MKSAELYFERSPTLNATQPPEKRNLARDEVRLLVSTSTGHTDTHFHKLAEHLRPGDLLVVNRSAVIPASLPVRSHLGTNLLNLSTHYGQGTWLAEPRWSNAQPGPMPLAPGDIVWVGETAVRLLQQHRGLPRLWFVRFAGDWQEVIEEYGHPIRYGYVNEVLPLAAYQTIFATVPGSAEMPSAARPFTPRVLHALQARGVGVAEITLHTGVSSHEIETEELEEQTLYAEPFVVPTANARAVNAARRAGRRVIAVGTTVVRALESAWDGEKVAQVQGFTHLYIHPARGVHTVNGLITSMHDSMASHLAMLYTIAEPDMIRSAYQRAIAEGYLWHEFGDSYLILP